MAPEKQQQSVDHSQEQALLHGGLRGRMAGAFCTLQSSVDALQRYLAVSSTPEVYSTACTMLEEMNRRIAMLQRVSGNAADLACGVLTRGAGELTPIDLAEYLSETAACVNEELSLRGFGTRLAVHSESGFFWAMASTGLVDGIVVNLLSNLLQVSPDSPVTITLGPERTLVYRDNGPGMDRDAAAALLERGEMPLTLKAKGALGLLLVREYALAMDWKIHVGQGSGMTLQFTLPEFDAAARRQMLRDSAGEGRSRSALFSARLERELDGVFGPADR